MGCAKMLCNISPHSRSYYYFLMYFLSCADVMELLVSTESWSRRSCFCWSSIYTR